jgi:hypothetical protein
MDPRSAEAKSTWSTKRVVVLSLATAALVAVTVGAVRLLNHTRDVRWARTVALPQISQLFDEGNLGEAYALAEKSEKWLWGDPELKKLWPRLSYPITVETTPAGASVYRRAYGKTNDAWELAPGLPRWPPAGSHQVHHRRQHYFHQVRLLEQRFLVATGPHRPIGYPRHPASQSSPRRQVQSPFPPRRSHGASLRSAVWERRLAPVKNAQGPQPCSRFDLSEKSNTIELGQATSDLIIFLLSRLYTW